MGVSFKRTARAAWIVSLASVLTVQVAIIVASLAAVPLLDARFLPLYLFVFVLAAAWCRRDMKRKDEKPDPRFDARTSLQSAIEGIFAHDRRAQEPLLSAVAVMPEEDARRVLAALAVGLMERPEIESALRKAHEIQDLEEEMK